jgi:hypothetical protein
MLRPTLRHWRLSEGPSALGICRDDVARCAEVVNAAQQRLLYSPEQGDEGFAGTWAEIAFSVDRDDPYITCPRGVARLEAVDVETHPIQLSNQFREYLLYGNGRLPKCERWLRRGGIGINQAMSRNNTPLFTDLKDPPQLIQVYATNPLDTQPNPVTQKIPRVLVQGTCRGTPIVSQDEGFTVQGEFITLASPYATTINTFDQITGIQKDLTQGEVQFFQSDPNWGSLEILLEMEPTETTAWYRRYYLSLPRVHKEFRRFRNVASQNPNCPIQPRCFTLVTALAKLDLIPVVSDTDYLCPPNVEAITLEAQSIRQSRIDNASSRQQASEYHRQAIRLLLGQLTHEQGKNQVAVLWKPFGSASLERVKINMT